MQEEQKVRVLIVDDDPSIVKLLARFVKDRAFRPVVADHADDALCLAALHEIPIAVIDLHMPEMEGIELMESLRRVSPEIEVILVTGDYSADSVTDALTHGAYDCLRKPLDFRHLSDCLNTLRDLALGRITQ